MAAAGESAHHLTQRSGHMETCLASDCNKGLVDFQPLGLRSAALIGFLFVLYKIGTFSSLGTPGQDVAH